MPNANTAKKKVVTLAVDRQLWNMAKALNMTLGPSDVTQPNARNMSEWVNFLIGRYVHEQTKTPEGRQKIVDAIWEGSKHATTQARLWMDDVKARFWENGEEWKPGATPRPTEEKGRPE